MTEPTYGYIPGQGWVPHAQPRRVRVDGSQLKEGDKVFGYAYEYGIYHEDWPNGHTLGDIYISGRARYENLVGRLDGYYWEVER